MQTYMYMYIDEQIVDTFQNFQKKKLDKNWLACTKVFWLVSFVSTSWSSLSIDKIGTGHPIRK